MEFLPTIPESSSSPETPMIQTTIDSYFNIQKEAQTELDIDEFVSPFDNVEATLQSQQPIINISVLDKYAMECWMFLEQENETIPFFERQLEFRQITSHFLKVKQNFTSMPIQKFIEWLEKHFPTIFHCSEVKILLYLHQLQKEKSDFNRMQLIRKIICQDKSLERQLCVLLVDIVTKMPISFPTKEQILRRMQFEFIKMHFSPSEQCKLVDFFTKMRQTVTLDEIHALVKNHLLQRGYISRQNNPKSIEIHSFLEKVSASQQHESSIHAIRQAIVSLLEKFQNLSKHLPEEIQDLFAQIEFVYYSKMQHRQQSLQVLQSSKSTKIASLMLIHSVEEQEQKVLSNFYSQIPSIISGILSVLHVEASELQNAIDSAASLFVPDAFAELFSHYIPSGGIKRKEFSFSFPSESEFEMEDDSSSSLDLERLFQRGEPEAEEFSTSLPEEETIQIVCELLSLQREEAIELLQQHNNLLSNILNSVF